MKKCGEVDVKLNAFLTSTQHVSELSASSPGHYIPEERAPTVSVETVIKGRFSAPVGSKFSNRRSPSSLPSHSGPIERNLLAPY
jgi:hypothetical protein